MSAVVAAAGPVPAFDRNPSPRSYPALAPLTAAPLLERAMESSMTNDTGFATAASERTSMDGKRSPRSYVQDDTVVAQLTDRIQIAEFKACCQKGTTTIPISTKQLKTSTPKA
jgi:hypothetical protein